MIPPSQTFAFDSAVLHAPSLYALLGNLNEVRLHVTETGAYCTGIGYRQEVALAFGKLIYYWEATTHLRFDCGLPVGVYSFDRKEEALRVYHAGAAQPFPDGRAEVRLVENRGEEE